MLIPSYAKQFERDMKLMRKRGKDLEKLKPVIRRLIAEEPLDAAYRDHKLIGNWQGRRECLIEPDWLSFGFISEMTASFKDRNQGQRKMSMFESIRQGLQEAVDFAEGKSVKAVVHDLSPPDVKAVHEHVGMTQAAPPSESPPCAPARPHSSSANTP